MTDFDRFSVKILRLGVLPSLQRCLATTNIVESPHAGVRIRTLRVTNWQNGSMARRWMASAFLRTEKNFRRIMGYRELWTLDAILTESQCATQLHRLPVLLSNCIRRGCLLTFAN
jgi:putative transposase